MFSISNTTTKRELLDYLKNNSNDNQDLSIFISSLPSFLNTQVAFTIFVYQIVNYPRKIVWVTSDLQIYEILNQINGVTVIKQDQTVASVQPTLTSDTSDKINTVSPQNTQSVDSFRILRSVSLNRENKNNLSSRINQQVNPIEQLQPVVIQPKPEHDLQNHTNPIEEKIHINNEKFDLDSLISSVQPTSKEPPQEINRFVSVQMSSNSTSADNQMSFKNLLSRRSFSSSNLLNQDFQGENNSQVNIPSDNDETQNLDSWLERIHATKQALNTLRTSDNSSTFLQKYSDFETTSNKKYLRRGLIAITTTLAGALIIFGGFVLFPTQAYTLSVRSIQHEETATLEIASSDFSTRSVLMTSKAETPASGQQQVQTDRSTGKVSLINPASGDVKLDNGKFRLESQGRVYEAMTNTTLPNSFAIPARNDLNGPAIEITIQSRLQGSEFNAVEGERFEITNFLNQKVCMLCYAVAITPIQNSQITGDKVVSDADYSLLRATTEGNLAQKRIEEIENIQDQRIFTNPNWYKNTGSDYTFTHPLGATTAIVGASVQVNTTLYYLPQDFIESRLKQLNGKINTVNRIALLESTGSVGTDEIISLKLFFGYNEKRELSQDEVKSNINQKTCEEARTDLIKQYPTIDYVDCRKLGLDVPGVPHRIDLTIVPSNPV